MVVEGDDGFLAPDLEAQPFSALFSSRGLGGREPRLGLASFSVDEVSRASSSFLICRTLGAAASWGA